MKKDQLIKSTLGALVILMTLYLYFNSERYNKYDWNETYEKESKSPYGNFMLYDLLKKYSGEENFKVLDEPIGITLSDTSLVNTNYIFKGLQSYYTYNDIKILQDYIARGNTVYILSNDDSFDLIYEMTESIDGAVYSYEDSVARMGMLESEHTLIDTTSFKFIVNWKLSEYDWRYIDYWIEEEYADEMTILGQYDNGFTNFIQVAHGKGFLYYHTSPIVFTNFFLKEEPGLAYAERVFVFLDGEKIFWDDFNHQPSEADNQGQGNPLRYIMSQPTLRWAWYLVLSMGVIYLLFYTRRKERIIPVLAANHNTSIEFIETMASLYMQPNGNLKIVRHKKKLFLEYIRHHYFIPINVLDEEFLMSVSLKSGIEKEKIDQILKEGDRLEFISQVSDEQLIAYHKQTEYFYNNCK